MPLTKKGIAKFLQSYGTLQTDKYGLSTASAIWYDRNDVPSIPTLGAAHPLWPELKSERINVTHEQTHFTVEVQYAGIFGTPTPIYELDTSVGEEPIETHPKFKTILAGTSAAPLNGAKFDATTGAFEAFVDGTNKLCGVRGYLSPGATYRKTIVQTTVPTSTGNVGTITSPPGAPAAPSGRSWMFMGVTYEQRGGCYTVREEWRLSGPRGWDTDIYSY